MINCKISELREILINILIDIGAEKSVAAKVCQSLIINEYCGYKSHGVMRILQYVKDAERSILQVNAKPKITNSGQIINIEGNHAFGVLIVESIINEIINSAADNAMVAVTVNNAHHVGRLHNIGATLASPPHNLFVIGFCNYLGLCPKVGPPKASTPRICTNPMLYAFPIENQPPFVLDISTSIIAEGKIAHAHIHDEQLPPGILINKDEQSVTNPSALYSTPPEALLASLGFPHVSHKGYGLGVFVEAIVGVLGGANNVCKTKEEGNGLFILALNPKYFKIENPFTLTKNIVEHCYKADNDNQLYRYPGLNSLESSKNLENQEIKIPLSIYNKILKLQNKKNNAPITKLEKSI